MTRTRWGWILISLLWCRTALANDVAACDPTNAQVPNAVTQVAYAAEFAPTNGFVVWYAPTNLDSPAQVTYLNTLKAQFDSLKSVPHRYWLCTDTNPVDGVLDGLTEMSQAQKDAMDAPEVAEAARQAAFSAEIVANDLCTAELSDVISRVETRRTTLRAAVETQRTTNNTTISGAANSVAGVKSAMTTVNNATAAEFGQTVDELASLATKIAKCVRARAR